MNYCIILLALVLLLTGCGPAHPTTAPTTPPIATESPLLATEPVTVPPSLPTTAPATEPPMAPITVSATTPEASADSLKNVKAMWLSQFDLENIYRDNGRQREKDDFTARMDTILSNIQACGFNTVFLQLRPYGDSMYPSEHYPMSAYVTGALGTEADYDPVETIVELARKRGLDIHAWLNPMRLMAEEEIGQVPAHYAIARWYADPELRGEYLVLHKGRWYLNPAYPEVRQLILAGAEEALTRYAFDGLHLDDYFYPTTDPAFDAGSFPGGDLGSWRRENLSQLVAGLYDLAKEYDVPFGISPAGNWNTVYEQQYADIYRWCGEPGYLDYICPQVYFGLEHGSFDFVKVCQTYQDMLQGDVVLLVGMTFGKALSREDQWAGAGKTEWADHRDVLARCLLTTKDLPACHGISVFCYQYFYEPLTGMPLPETREERDNFVTVLQEMLWN